MFNKPLYFLMDEPTKRIIICGEDKSNAEFMRGMLGLTLTASVYCGITQYNLSHMTDWTTHNAELLLENK